MYQPDFTVSMNDKVLPAPWLVRSWGTIQFQSEITSNMEEPYAGNVGVISRRIAVFGICTITTIDARWSMYARRPVVCVYLTGQAITLLSSERGIDRCQHHCLTVNSPTIWRSCRGIEIPELNDSVCDAYLAVTEHKYLCQKNKALI